MGNDRDIIKTVPREKSFDWGKFKKASEETAKFLGVMIRDNQRRKNKLINKIIPLLKPETIKEIVRNHKVLEGKLSDEKVLKRHLEGLIEDFDNNVHEMKESEVPAVAAAMNKNPLISFFIPEDD